MPPFISLADCQRVAAGAANVLIFRITNDLFKFVRGNVMLGQMLDDFLGPDEKIQRHYATYERRRPKPLLSARRVIVGRRSRRRSVGLSSINRRASQKRPPQGAIYPGAVPLGNPNPKTSTIDRFFG
jgi:hypothetical protein